MTGMQRRFPGSREQSVYASVELSLRRLSPESRKPVRVLGVFHGAADQEVLHLMMGWDESDCASLAAELVATGLATPDPGKRGRYLLPPEANCRLPRSSVSRGGCPTWVLSPAVPVVCCRKERLFSH